MYWYLVPICSKMLRARNAPSESLFAEPSSRVLCVLLSARRCLLRGVGKKRQVIKLREHEIRWAESTASEMSLRAEVCALKDEHNSVVGDAVVLRKRCEVLQRENNELGERYSTCATFSTFRRVRLVKQLFIVCVVYIVVVGICARVATSTKIEAGRSHQNTRAFIGQRDILATTTSPDLLHADNPTALFRRCATPNQVRRYGGRKAAGGDKGPPTA